MSTLTKRSAGIALLLWAGLACRKSAPPQQPDGSASNRPEALDVVPDAGLLFTYVEPRGSFAATPEPEQVPSPSRRVVRVVDPKRPVADTGEISEVYVLDLNQFLSSGKGAAQRMSREAFETAALAQLPPGESTPWRPGQPRPPSAPGAGPPVAASPTPSGAVGPDAGTASSAGAPVVTIYGTSWCGACRAARQYFTERKIPFLDKDIEQDAGAARELQVKAARMGVGADRVPVLDIRGRLLLGFDRARVEALLGDPT